MAADDYRADAGERSAARCLSISVAGRKIRWANAGRAAAIAAAVLAGLASLPALLGGDEPPPLPEDVGLAQVAPSSVTAPPAPAAPVPVKPPKAAEPPKKRLAAKEAAAARRDARRSKRENSAGDDSDAVAPAVTFIPTYSPTYTPSYPAVPPREAFDFER